MFGNTNGKGSFQGLMGELKLRPASAPAAFMGQSAPAAQAPSSPVPGPVSAAPAPTPAPAPVAAPTDTGIPHQTQVLISGGLVLAALLGSVLLSD